MIEKIRAEKNQVVRVWHPEPIAPLIEVGNGANAEVLVGAPAYQVSNGDITKL